MLRVKFMSNDSASYVVYGRKPLAGGDEAAN